jgi:hypothetical protein
MRNKEDLKLLRAKLKSGEYDGSDIMQAWIAVDELMKANDLIAQIHNELEYGEVYQWDGGQVVWQNMRDYCA